MNYHYLPALLLALPLMAAAQDQRTVREPNVPAVCQLVSASLQESDLQRQQATAPDTFRLQQALEQCPEGQAVRLRASAGKVYFLSGPLSIRRNVSLLIDAGVTLAASRLAADYDKGEGRCGSVDAKGRACKTFLSFEKTRGAGIYGDGIIDGQGGQKLIGQTESWWELARRAQREDKHQNVPRLIEFNQASEAVLHKIWLRNSANFHVSLNQVDGFTAWGVHIDTPANARNTDGIDPISSRNITITHSFIRTGDDNVAIKAGTNGPSENISVIDNHFYSGHGMSIGSETQSAVRNVLVKQLRIDGATSGLRIKSDVSRGGQVGPVRYEQVCIKNSKTPLDFDSFYGKRASGNLIPEYGPVTLEQVHVLTPGRLVFRAYDAAHPLKLALKQVYLPAGSSQQQLQTAHVNWLQAPQQSDISADLTLQQQANAPACALNFLEFPDYAALFKRPQLTAQQAEFYSYAQVLGYAGLPGQEQADPWDPLAQGIPDAVALEAGKADYIVDQHSPLSDGRHFKSLQQAINQIVRDLENPALQASRLHVLIRPGNYQELLYIPATRIPLTLVGSGAASTRIYAKLDAALTGAQYQQRFASQFVNAPESIQRMYQGIADKAIIGTFGTPVVWARSQGLQVRDLSIENSYNKDVGNARQECLEASCAGDGVYAKMNMVHHQALALMSDGIDRAHFEQVRLLGFQDTLYLRAGSEGRTARNFFNRSYIEGDVDFIFGDATAYFLDSEVRSLGDRSTSYVAAPSTNLKARYGLVFERVNFTHDGSHYARAGKFYLARQWFHNQRCTPYGKVAIADYRCSVGEQDQFTAPAGTITRKTIENVGKMVVLNSRLGAHLNPARPWSDWNKNGTLPYRPAQYSSQDFWNNLQQSLIKPADFSYQSQPDYGVFLAEFNSIAE